MNADDTLFMGRVKTMSESVPVCQNMSNTIANWLELTS